MKGKDISLIVVIGIVSAVLAVILSSFLIPDSDKNQSVETVEPIQAEFERPPRQYFNSDSINPTREIEIGQDEASNPFSND